MIKTSTESHLRPLNSARSTRTFLIWIILWTASYVVADKGLLYPWSSSTGSALFAVLINLALGLGMVYAYMRHLRAMDELQRKIQMDALALALGAGIVGGFSLMLLHTTGLSLGADINDLILLIFITHMVSTVVGMLRYR